MKSISFLFAAISAACLSLFSLSGQTSSSQTPPVMTQLESILPPSPEAASRTRFVDSPVGWSQGTAEYEVPFHTLKGRELSLGIALRYASGGIPLDEVGGVAGLGWTLEAGGCVSRTVCDMPDEYVGADCRFELVSDPDSPTLRDLMWKRIDTRPDRYSYNVCGLSGSFFLLHDPVTGLDSIESLSGDGVKISVSRAGDGSVDSFTLVGPDGTVYEMTEKEVSTHNGSHGIQADYNNSHLDVWSATTCWYVSRITSCSGLESAVFEYASAGPWSKNSYSTRHTVSVVDGPNDPNPTTHIVVSYITHSCEAKVLSRISLSGAVASFSYASGTGSDRHSDFGPYCAQNYPVRLAGIGVRYTGSSYSDSLAVGTERATYDGRIILGSLRRYRSGVEEDRWAFRYDTRDHVVDSHEHDWYGFYNAQTMYRPYDFGTEYMLVKQGGTPDASQATYMSLLEVDHDGAKTVFSYEGNTWTAGPDTTSIGVRVSSISLSDRSGVRQVREITYEEPRVTGPAFIQPWMYVSVGPVSISGDGLVMTRSWSFTAHDSPVAAGRTARDTRVVYGKVTETVGDSRTVRHFDTVGLMGSMTDISDLIPSEVMDLYRFQNPPCISIDPLACTQTVHYSEDTPAPCYMTREEEQTRWENGRWTILWSTDYEYGPRRTGRFQSDYQAREMLKRGSLVGAINPDYVVHYPVYCSVSRTRKLLSQTHVEHHAGESLFTAGCDTSRVEYTYVPQSLYSDPQRVKTETTRSGGARRRVEYSYADSYRASHAPENAAGLRAAHMLSIPLRKDWSVERPDTTIHEFIPITRALPAAATTTLQPTEWHVWKSEVNTYSALLLPSSRSTLFEGRESWKEEYRSYNRYGKVCEFKTKGSPSTVIIWSYGGLYPIAVVENATRDEVDRALYTFDSIHPSDINGLCGNTNPGALAFDRVESLRTALPQARITTFRYLLGVGMTRMEGPDRVVKTFEYDHAGRLVASRVNGVLSEQWEYDLYDSDGDGLLSARHRTYTGYDGADWFESVRWWDVLGLTLQDIAIGAGGDGEDLVTAYECDGMLHDDAKVWKAYPVSGTGGAYQSDAASSAAAYHSSSRAFFGRTYEASRRNKVLSESVPGNDSAHETAYRELSASGFPLLVWENGGIVRKGTYPDGDVAVNRQTDPEGRRKWVWKDHGDIILASANADEDRTLYVYDDYERLRAVAGGGIDLSDTLNMWRYDYDSLGRVSSKAVPGSVREFYTYDEEDRVVSVRKGDVLRETEYDIFGRPTRVYLTDSHNTRVLVEEHCYDTAHETGATLAVIGPMGIAAAGGQYVSFGYGFDVYGRQNSSVAVFQDGSRLSEDKLFRLQGQMHSSCVTLSDAGHRYTMDIDNTFDSVDRLVSAQTALQGAHDICESYGYDALGRLSEVLSGESGLSCCVRSEMEFNLADQLVSKTVRKDGSLLYKEDLERNCAGQILSKSERHSATGLFPSPTVSSFYSYDDAGRLGSERRGHLGTSIQYTYDPRGNILSAGAQTYQYDADRITGCSDPALGVTAEFDHDEFGRMTVDGLNGVVIEYNYLDLPSRILSTDGQILVNYTYLANGKKLSSLKSNGEGLVYRGPFTFRRSSGGEMEFESAACESGRLTENGTLLYVKDHIGSVMEVVDAGSGAVKESSEYKAWGDRTERSSSSAGLPTALTLRDHFCGLEDQEVDFGVPYNDHSARHYNPALRRWMVPDPLSEKYYGLSPYNYCGNDPLEYIDPSGQDLVFTSGDDARITIKTDKIDYTLDLSNIGVTWEGEFTLSGDEILSAALDIAGIVDPTGIADSVNASIYFSNGKYWDGAISALGVIPFLGDAAKVGRLGKSLMKIGENLGDVKLLSFTRSNFKKNLIRLYGDAPGMQAHHIFPNKFYKEFKDIGINVHDPHYGVWLEKHLHLSRAKEYNKAWESFFKSDPTIEKAFTKAKELMHTIYGQ